MAIGTKVLKRPERQVRGDKPENRRHDVAGDGAVGLERTDDLDRSRIEQDFLVRLANGRLEGVFAGIEAAAGKGDLAGVGPQMLAPDGQDDARLRPVGDGDHHRRRKVCVGTNFRQVAVERWLRRRLCERSAKAVGQSHSGTFNGKKTSSLQMPGEPSESASSASS